MSFTQSTVAFTSVFNSKIEIASALSCRMINQLLAAGHRFVRAINADRLPVNERLLRDIGCSPAEAGRYDLEVRADGQARSMALVRRPTAPLL